MQPVECRACGASVLVEKNSLAHTSVQWTTTANRTCVEFAAGVENALIPSCRGLRASIDRAVVAGEIEVGA